MVRSRKYREHHCAWLPRLSGGRLCDERTLCAATSTERAYDVLLAELDDELTPEGLSGPCRIVIVGGAAVALRVPNRVTVDVDVVSEGMPMALRLAAERVAARHGLRTDWVNDGAKAKTVAVRAEPEVVFEGANLVVEAASPKYILAMKLTSAR